MDPDKYLIKPSRMVDLAEIPTDDTRGVTKPEGKEQLEALAERLVKLQNVFYADGSRALLVVFQGMDTSGKDGVIRDVFGPLNAQGCYVESFKVPAGAETRHDYLWRVHAKCPQKGMIGIFNRSHYEDVGVVRVHNLVPPATWNNRYRHIKEFERMLADEGTIIRKFFLHISKEEQRERLEARLADPDKHWKFDPKDVEERKFWDAYQEAYSDAIGATSTKHAPWHVVPSDHKWYRNLVVATVMVQTLGALNLEYPTPDFDPKKIKVV